MFARRRPGRGAGLPVDGAQADQAMEMPETPAMVHEFRRQPVQQRGMCRRAALVAKIATLGTSPAPKCRAQT